jgi:hypothetical protein
VYNAATAFSATLSRAVTGISGANDLILASNFTST